MYRLHRRKHRVVHNQAPGLSVPLDLYVVSSTFQLVTFVAIACYVVALTHEGHGLAGAVAAAVAVAMGARVNGALHHAST